MPPQILNSHTSRSWRHDQQVYRAAQTAAARLSQGRGSVASRSEDVYEYPLKEY
jgi:hypothetical protein